jgi:hypothetical protein
MYREEWYEAKIAEYKKLFTGSSFWGLTV